QLPHRLEDDECIRSEEWHAERREEPDRLPQRRRNVSPPRKIVRKIEERKTKEEQEPGNAQAGGVCRREPEVSPRFSGGSESHRDAAIRDNATSAIRRFERGWL